MPGEQERLRGVPVHGPAAPHHRRITRTVLYLVVATVLAATTTVVAVRRMNAPAAPTWPASAGQDGASSCTDPVGGQQWRVSWSTTEDLGVRILGLRMRHLPDGLWQDRGTAEWQLRWDQAPAERAGADFAWDHSLTAPLAGLSRITVAAGLSPRLVAPDGGCTVYVAPFGPGAAGPGSVAVVGDSLVAQLVPGPAVGSGGSGPGEADPGPGAAGDSGTGSGAGADPGSGRRPGTRAPTSPGSQAGPLAMALATAGYRVQIDGQGGRRWVSEPPDDRAPDTPGTLDVQAALDPLDRADITMLDELRGLREAGTVVAALGTNDASWTALAEDETGFEGRLSWTLGQLRRTLEELSGQGRCTVLVTMAAAGKATAGTDRGNRFERAAARINDLLRGFADASPQLALYDWGAQADQHAAGTRQSWFGADTIHFSADGVAAYARALADAAELGCA